MSNKIKALFNDKKGLTLVETLVAITILALVLFCITPLFLANLDTIRISGDKAVKVYNNAGIMQKILANFETGDETANAGYDIDVANANITLSGNGSTYTVAAQGDLLVSNPTDISLGYATVMADSPDSNFQVFPRSLTDDFKEAYLTVAAIGFSFVNEPGDDIYELYCNKNGTRTRLKYGEDYTMRRVESDDPTVQNRVMQIILYGGTDVNFGNSPLTFKYKGYEKRIQVDAPSMIMVGEESSDGYRYYVSRGETEKDSNGNDRLIVLEREMENVPLTSAMNDVEWVSAEDADEYAVGKDGEKYGYYVMCGDHGQVRRFWQNKTTGNYYWGGDYTYYTDIQYNRTDSKSYFSAVKTENPSTNVSYKFSTKRPLNIGFNLGNKNDKISIQNRNLWSVTALGDDPLNTVFYASDGKLFYYFHSDPSKQLSVATIGQFDNAINNILAHRNKKNEVSWGGYNLREVDRLAYANHESYAWLKADKDSYYDINGIPHSVNKDSYPITLTSVGAIVLTGSGNYETNVRNGSYDLATNDGNAELRGDVSYPTSTYTLYCGYIPAAMDVWSTDNKEKTADDRGTEFRGAMITKDGNYKFNEATRGTLDSKVLLDDGTKARITNQLEGSEVEKNMLWRGSFGITPYLTTGTTLNIDGTSQTAWSGYAEARDWGKMKKWYDFMGYWPYTNLKYAVTGKFYDSTVSPNMDGVYAHPELMKNLVYSLRDANSLPQAFVLNDVREQAKQTDMTNGRVVDITVGYLSHPLAMHLAANPMDGKVFPVQNTAIDLDNIAQIWNNRRENMTILDIASTKVPTAGEQDIPVSLAVGYTMGGIVEYSSNKDAYVNTIMNNGIVYLRAGDVYIGTGAASNSTTGEYYCTDKDGYKLNQESNYFHQFYFLDTKCLESSVDKLDMSDERNYVGAYAGKDQYQSAVFGKHIGDMYGARFWQNNRHIQYLSLNGTPADYNDHNNNARTGDNDWGGNGNINYLRSHPLNNTKVTCVAWGTTWDNNPQAMWGTENGTLLSWYVDLNAAKDLANESDYYRQNGKEQVAGVGDFGGEGSQTAKNAAEWNAISTVAEFQRYSWIDNVSNKAFASSSDNFKYTIGAHSGQNGLGNAKWDGTLQTFNVANVKSANMSSFRTFYDRTTQECNLYNDGYSFVSTLETINDIDYANDYWVAVGDQSDRNPDEYCGGGTLKNPGNKEYGGSTGELQAYSSRGEGSWVNVRYWWDKDGSGVASETNDHYLWKAVKISDNPNYNIVQINCLNGVWYATGYEDKNGNGEWDKGEKGEKPEKAVVCWARDPLADCNALNGIGNPAEGRWSENTQFYRTTGKGQYQPMDAADVGGINSVACRDDM